ncbi:hypothetical protein C8R45DRAFT_1106897 [Mycena sanguinolenta]|nr:hypothetical protein C8R45DRAFT_1106897 [Mycena sanguinolenta]
MSDLEPHSEPEFEVAVVATTNNTELATNTGAFFTNATGFTLAGGIFTSNIYNSPWKEQCSEFQTIRLGDIKLGKELKNISLNAQSGMLGWQNRDAGVRRMYSAEIHRDPTPATVAMYQGDAAEEEWREHLAKYETIRHISKT